MKPSLRTLGLVTATLLAFGAAGLAIGDSDDDDDDDHHGGWIKPGRDVAPVTNATYAEECGACHMAYQPGLLSAAAWQQIMRADALADHYGDDASLSDDLTAELAAYLGANSADQASRSRSRAFAVGDADSANLPRITETRYFRKEHDEIPARMVADNPDVGSFSNCNACHQGAAEGVYNEHRVRIPGFGPWDDCALSGTPGSMDSALGSRSSSFATKNQEQADTGAQGATGQPVANQERGTNAAVSPSSRTRSL